ncbi:MAG: T9SS type A sorting domain-containing protein [candidate division Zixibacteria bacterium]|nr:T9SS type A sorting domain-containing protein [candidate division Zixibacteria bacterium]
MSLFLTRFSIPSRVSGPHRFQLKQNYPNPFNGETIISYYLPDPAQVELNIINMRGELVAQPVKTKQQAGNHQLIWEGARDDGTPVSTGIYFYELKVSGVNTPTYPKSVREIKAMILLK